MPRAPQNPIGLGRRMTDKAGNQIGQYQVVARLRDWSQGKVYQAVCTATDNPNVARNEMVVLIVADGVLSEQDEESIRTRAGMLLSLDHPNIAGIREFFIHEQKGKRIPCFAAEFLSGKSLVEVLKERGAGLDWEKTQQVIRQCLKALIYARNRGVLHCAVTPASIFVGPDGVAKITGFAVLCGRAGTRAIEVRGADYYGYVAPELKNGEQENDDEITDIFSIGMVLYKLLTGIRAFAGPADGRNDLRDRPSFSHGAFRVLNSQCRTIVMKSVTRNRDNRFTQFEQVLATLETVKQRTIQASGKYELLEYLCRGGFGEVYRGRNIESGQEVAVKYLYSDQQPARFLREARLLKKSDNRHIVRYIDFAEMESISGDSRYFLIMEYLAGMPGWSLKNRLTHASRGLDLNEVLVLFSNYLDGLQYLHENNIIHRDIKPGNLYAPEAEPGEARIFDMGISRDISGTVTTGHVPGTLDYMPPEFAVPDNERGSPRSDIYSMGLSFYEALAGKTAYPRLPKSDRKALVEFVDRASGCRKLAVDYARSPFNECPRLREIVARAIESDPSKRFHCARDMKSAIDKVIAGSGGGPAADAPAQERAGRSSRPGKQEAAAVVAPARRERTPEPRPAGPRPSHQSRNRRKSRIERRSRRSAPVQQVPEPAGAGKNRYLFLRLLLFGTAILAVVAVGMWGVQEIPLRNARREMRVSCGLLDVPKPLKTYVMDVRRTRAGIDPWLLKDKGHREQWLAWQELLTKRLCQVPLVFKRGFQQAMERQDRSEARMLMLEWEGTAGYAADMELSAEEHAGILLDMRRGTDGMNLLVEITSLENRIPVKLEQESLERAEAVASECAVLLDTVDRMHSDEGHDRLKAVAERLVTVGEDYVKRVSETAVMWYLRGKVENGDRKHDELKAMKERAPLLSGIIIETYQQELARLAELSPGEN